jgi:Ser/Thr protein kinase RdoA (MazF antagonist)
MMKLNLMKQFFDSVDKDWRSPIADEIAARWFGAGFHAYCLRASANFAFKIRADGQDYLLRFNHASERQIEHIAAELAYIEHLAGNGIRVARPLPSLAGRLIESVSTPMGLFHGVLFEFLSGRRLDLADLDAKAIRHWGRALGQMHGASEGLKIEGRPGWQAQIAMIRALVPTSEILVWQETGAVEENLRKLPIHATNYGLIHFDFEPDNIVWVGEEIGIYDLDDCVYGWFVMDASNALSSELYDDRLESFDFTEPRLVWFLEGYRSVRSLSEQEVKWMPLLLRLDNLVAFARVYRSISDDPVGNEPEWTVNLRQKLSRELDKLRDSFRHYPIRDFVPGVVKNL